MKLLGSIAYPISGISHSTERFKASNRNNLLLNTILRNVDYAMASPPAPPPLTRCGSLEF